VEFVNETIFQGSVSEILNRARDITLVIACCTTKQPIPHRAYRTSLRQHVCASGALVPRVLLAFHRTAIAWLLAIPGHVAQ
jgi:hypothetical protein